MGFNSSVIPRVTEIKRGDKIEQVILPRLKKGDRVENIMELQHPIHIRMLYIPKGTNGTVRVARGFMGLVGVSFANFEGGFKVDKHMKQDSGWWVSPTNLKKV